MRRTSLKKCIVRWGASTAVMLLCVVPLDGGRALAQVHLTKHNLGSNKDGPQDRRSSMAEICVFCHTPFGAESSAAAPLWNRNQAQASTYATYNSLGTSSLDGAAAPVGSVSIACLSCHDGGQAMNSMINMPGASTARNARTLAVDAGKDHPVGVQYGGGPGGNSGPPVAPAVYLNTSMKNSDFSSAQSATLNGQMVWWVDTTGGTRGAREKTDIQLYTRITTPSPGSAAAPSEGASERSEPFIECASCHDPHSGVNATFLRVANAAGAVCLACHNKM